METINETFRLSDYFSDGQLLRKDGKLVMYSSLLNAIVWIKIIKLYGGVSLDSTRYDAPGSIQHIYFKSETLQDFCAGKGVPLIKKWYETILSELQESYGDYEEFPYSMYEDELIKLDFKKYFDNPNIEDVGFNNRYIDLQAWKRVEWFDGEEWNSILDIENQEIIVLTNKSYIEIIKQLFNF